MKLRHFLLFNALGTLACVLVLGCASWRQAAIVADQAFSTTVFALDDAEYAACQAKVLTPAQCDSLNTPIKKALEDVKALTLAIKAAPASASVPKSLPDLLTDLGDVQAILMAFQNVAPDLVSKASAANLAAVHLLAQIAGQP